MNGLHCIVFIDMIFQDIHLDNISQFMTPSHSNQIFIIISITHYMNFYNIFP